MSKKNHYSHRMRKLKGKQEPGPGQYKIVKYEGINADGHYVNSKHHNLPNYTFGFGVGKRETEIERLAIKNSLKSPDPGRYFSGIIEGEKLVKDKTILTGYRSIKSAQKDRPRSISPGPG